MRKERKRLIVLPPSHYCERARWALDHKRVAYTEVPWAVGCHVPLAKRLAPATTLPILVTGETVIQGSDRILDWADVSGGDAQVEGRFGGSALLLVTGCHCDLMQMGPLWKYLSTGWRISRDADAGGSAPAHRPVANHRGRDGLRRNMRDSGRRLILVTGRELQDLRRVFSHLALYRECWPMVHGGAASRDVGAVRAFRDQTQ
jgi:Glutathione S-transferase, N-terminal domain